MPDEVSLRIEGKGHMTRKDETKGLNRQVGTGPEGKEGLGVSA